MSRRITLDGDIAYVTLIDTPAVHHTVQQGDNVYIDYSDKDEIVGIEILGAEVVNVEEQVTASAPHTTTYGRNRHEDGF